MIKIWKYTPDRLNEILARPDQTADVGAVVTKILQDVKDGGDAALMEYSRRFDGAPEGGALSVSAAEMEAAVKEVDAEFLAVMERAAANIRAFHEKQIRSGFVMNEKEGVVLGQKIVPLARVGLYVPGGTASYPSTVLMDASPAKLAGVGEVIMATPAKGGVVAPQILAAAKIAGVDRIFKMGGAQAVAALAFGTESVPRVDKIVGPGNAFVAEAKRQVYGQVAIDMIAGPSDIMIIADENCNPVWLAADMLSQSEHDKNSAAVLLCTSEALALAVQTELERQLLLLPREEIARASVENNGKIIVTADIAEAVDVANALAPEHLELCLDAPFDYLDRVRCAGSVFLGKNAPEALGDYFAGPNHTLPTNATARFSSPLSVDDFVKKYSFTYYTRDALEKVQKDVRLFAQREGLQAHARSVQLRFEEDGE